MAGGSLRRDILSAYVLTAARVLAWVVVAAVVYRTCRPRYFAALALVRATVGLLGYASLGIGPALVRALAGAKAEEQDEPFAP
ncbi:MAG TPA: hypothetical protein VK324_02535, partial [Tepidisphaeraceae bacterium]|nr:hypothetical protein [Tepidisphaeraceae bacterium]